MSLHEIVLPPTEPETEWVRGRALQKVSATYVHAALQMLVASALDAWAFDGDRGRVGTAWRFRVAPPGEIVRPLVPDVAYLSFDDLARDVPLHKRQVPLGAPTVAVEIVTADDRRADIDDKIATYVRAAAKLVVVVDPDRATVTLHDVDGARVLRDGDTLVHAALPGFSLDLGALFARARR